jgi:hypothetical protein|mmetsp:Transcript_21933/g.39808  ORF Transcript_21933/g.39808 Transcript_21933/m.39808 type:complete len:106 (+) Transcript_21933:1008-1325(+)
MRTFSGFSTFSFTCGFPKSTSTIITATLEALDEDTKWELNGGCPTSSLFGCLPSGVNIITRGSDEIRVAFSKIASEERLYVAIPLLIASTTLYCTVTFSLAQLAA